MVLKTAGITRCSKQYMNTTSCRLQHRLLKWSVSRGVSGAALVGTHLRRCVGRSYCVSPSAAASTTSATMPKEDGIAAELLNFINYSWTPFHAVEEGSRMLLKAGFKHIAEKDAWNIVPGGKYFFTRNMSTLVAFAVGEKYQPGNGVYMVGAHTDSPCLKLKAISKNVKSECLMVGVETYGGGLWHTWFDRDLSVAGRVLVRAEDGTLKQQLVKVDRPILRVPMLAIHLQRDISDGFKPNTQNHLTPLLATSLKAQLGKQPQQAGGEKSAVPTMEDKHHTALLSIISEQLGCKNSDIVDFDLNVCDTTPGVIGGAFNEFIFAGRLDNLAMSFIALNSLIDSCENDNALSNETAVRAIALFDHEEVGSDSAQGAGSPVMRDTITRVANALSQGQEGAVERAMRQSFLVSADMAHALHPNYADKHDPQHQPKFHQGLVIKHNENQRYATNCVSAALFREVARKHNLPVQEFSVRNDMACGSTIGPILASKLGCRTVDIGVPQLSMHSIREMCGVDDIAIAYKHFLAFFREFSDLDATLDIDSLPPPYILGRIADTPCGHVH